MPMLQKRVLIDGAYTREEYVTISQGYLPQSAQDKWFIYLDDLWLHFHRSATGACIFKLKLEPVETYYSASELLINADPRQYKNEDDAYSLQLVAYLIDHYLLGRFSPFPQPANLSAADQLKHQAHVIGANPNEGLTLRVVNGR
jgi:hypothetical protein